VAAINTRGLDNPAPRSNPAPNLTAPSTAAAAPPNYTPAMLFFECKGERR